MRKEIKNKIEAFGQKGMKNIEWRKEFKSEEALNAWLEKNDAVCLGVRNIEE